MEKRKLCSECSKKQREWWKNRSEEFKQKHHDSSKRWALKNPEKRKAIYLRHNRKCKAEAIKKYGGKCACCGESNSAFLTVDHINGGGNAHRRSIFGANVGGNFYTWLKTNRYPAGFQILCYNCNMAKAHLGTCPHKTELKK